MPPEAISVGEFTRTTDRMFEQLDRIEAGQTANRIAIVKLEANQEAAGKLSAKLSATVSLLVTAVAQVTLSVFGGKA